MLARAVVFKREQAPRIAVLHQGTVPAPLSRPPWQIADLSDAWREEEKEEKREAGRCPTPSMPLNSHLHSIV